MQRQRVILVTVVVLAVVSVTVLGLAIYPLSELQPRQPEASFEIPEEESFAINASIVTDGKVSLSVEGTVSDDGAYMRTVQPDAIEERYRSDKTGEKEYVRRVVSSEDAPAIRSMIDQHDREKLVNESSEGDTVAFVSRIDAPSTSIEERLTSGASVVLTQLRLAQYEPREHTAGTIEPRSGWYGGGDPYRLIDAEGSIELEPGTAVLTSAMVEWTLVTNTDSYLHYLVQRGTAMDQVIRYEYVAQEDVDPEIGEPPWLPEG